MHLYGLDELDGEDVEQTDLFQDRLIELVEEKTLIAQVNTYSILNITHTRHTH